MAAALDDRRVQEASTSWPRSGRPTATSPTSPGTCPIPENPKTLDAAIAEAKATGADLVLASDPDADRIGVAIPVTGDPTGEWTTLDGNQIGVLLAAFVIKETEALGRLRSDHYLVTTLVSTQMARAVGQREGIRTEDDLLVGFKWIAQRIDEAGPAGFLFGFEESHGYLKGDPRPRQGRRRGRRCSSPSWRRP